jgi:hypothetical protein
LITHLAGGLRLTIGQATSRQEIAEAVSRHIDVFRHRPPKQRKPWQAEERRMAMFCAAALVLAHYQLGQPSHCNEAAR